MATARHAETVDEAPATRFVLDSHHLALLDRFVARARRDARREEKDFTGVVVEIDSARPRGPRGEPEAVGARVLSRNRIRPDTTLVWPGSVADLAVLEESARWTGIPAPVEERPVPTPSSHDPDPSSRSGSLALRHPRVQHPD